MNVYMGLMILAIPIGVVLQHRANEHEEMNRYLPADPAVLAALPRTVRELAATRPATQFSYMRKHPNFVTNEDMRLAQRMAVEDELALKREAEQRPLREKRLEDEKRLRIEQDRALGRAQSTSGATP